MLRGLGVRRGLNCSGQWVAGLVGDAGWSVGESMGRAPTGAALEGKGGQNRRKVEAATRKPR